MTYAVTCSYSSHTCRNKTLDPSGLCHIHRGARPTHSLSSAAASSIGTVRRTAMKSAEEREKDEMYSPSRFGLEPGRHFTSYDDHSSGARFKHLSRGVWEGLTDSNRQAIRDYVCGESEYCETYYGLINDGFRNDSKVPRFSDLDQEDRDSCNRIAEELDQMLDYRQLDQPVLTYRGISLSEQEYDQMMSRMSRGSTIHDEGYWSTSISPNTASEFGGRGKKQTVVFEIITDRGMPMCHDIEADLAGEEYEMLCPRGSSFTVTEVIEGEPMTYGSNLTADVTYNTRRKKTVVRVVESMLFDRTRHDEFVPVYGTPSDCG